MDQEINLMDYIKTIIKKWKMVLGITVGITVVVFLFSFFSPRIYEVSTILEIGRFGRDITTEKGVITNLIGAPVQVINKIEEEIYEDISGVKAENPSGTDLIVMKTKTSNVVKTEKDLKKLADLIILDHQNISENQRELAEKQINFQEGEIKRLETKISLAEKEKKLIEEKVESLEKIGPYQQSSTFQLSLLDEKQKLENKKTEIENLYSSILNLKNQVFSAKNSLKFIQPTKIVKSPSASKNPVGPKILFNTLVAVILGLFIGLISAFGREWWAKQK